MNVKLDHPRQECIAQIPCVGFVAVNEYKGGMYFIGADKVFPSVPRIAEMLPGEESSGSYIFRIRSLQQGGKSTHAGFLLACRILPRAPRRSKCARRTYRSRPGIELAGQALKKNAVALMPKNQWGLVQLNDCR